jgi:hypothetical protein
MATTTTTRLGLTKPTPGSAEPVSVAAHINDPYDRIDAAIGLGIYTSSTRPAAPWHGELIRETNTDKVYYHNGSSPASGGWRQILSQGATYDPALTLGSTLTVTGVATCSSNLSVAGSGHITGALAVDGNATVTGNLVVTGYGPGRCLARARRITSSSTTTGTTDIGVLRMDDVAIPAGHLIAIMSSPLAIDGATANDEIRARMRYTTDGSTPSVSSTILPGSKVQIRQTDANVPEQRTIFTTYTPAGAETLSILLCTSHVAGTGAAGIFADGTEDIIEFSVWDMGVDPGDTGTDI